VLRIPSLGSDEEFAVRLLEQHSVVVHPGHFYDFRGEGYVVVSLLTPEETMRKGIRRLVHF
jgi:aspartate/methionine/tyrosine aminotransferase